MKKKYYENADITFNGLKWTKGLIPAVIGGALIYLTVRYYSWQGVDSAMEVADGLFEDLHEGRIIKLAK